MLSQVLSVILNFTSMWYPKVQIFHLELMSQFKMLFLAFMSLALVNLVFFQTNSLEVLYFEVW